MGTRDVTAARFNVPSKSVTWESGRRRRRPVASLFGKVEGGGFGGGLQPLSSPPHPLPPPSALHKQHGGSGFSPSVFVNPGLVLLQEQRRSEDYVNWKKKVGEGWGRGRGAGGNVVGAELSAAEADSEVRFWRSPRDLPIARSDAGNRC